jgi:hypothetical protein
MPAALLLGAAAATGLTATIGGAIGAAIVGSAVSTVAATAIGTAVIAGGITAVQGGSVSDVLKSAVLGGITAGVGSGIASSIASDVAFNAIASGVGGKTAVIMGNVLGGAAAGAISSGTSALLSGRDPIEALIKGGLTAGLSAGVNTAVGEFTKDIDILSKPTGSQIGDAFQRATKTAIATGILGGSAKDAFTQSALTSFAGIGLNYIKDGVKDYSAQVKAEADNVKNVKDQIDSNLAQQQNYVDAYNNLAKDINNRYADVQNATADYDDAKRLYNAVNEVFNYGWSNDESYLTSKGYQFYNHSDENGSYTTFLRPGGEQWEFAYSLAEEKLNDLNNKANNANRIIESYNEFYNQNIGTFNSYSSTLDGLKNQYEQYVGQYKTSADNLDKAVQEFQVQETKNAALALKGIEDTATAKSLFKEQTGRDPTDDELAQYATNGDLVGNVDRAGTSSQEATALFEQAFGRQPTSSEIQQITGRDEAAAAQVVQDQKSSVIRNAQSAYSQDTGGQQLSDSQLSEVLRQSDPARYVDTLATSLDEARAFWRSSFGTEPTEAELGQMVGLSEQQAASFIYDKDKTDAAELDQIIQGTAGNRLPLTQEQKNSLLGLNEMQAQDRITKLTQAANVLEGQGGTLNQSALDYLFNSQNPTAAANALYTTEAEARQFWRQNVGTEPTEAELMGLIGLSESSARTEVGNIAYDRGNVSSDELDQFLRDIGKGQIALTNDEMVDLLGRSEADTKNIIAGKYNEFVADKNSTDGQEAVDLWKKAGLSEKDLTADHLQMMMRGSEATAETYAQRLADVRAVTYEGDPAMNQAATEAAAKAAGYNNYIFNNKPYLVNDSNLAAAFDGRLQQETAKLIQRVVEANGLSMADLSQDQIAQIRAGVHAVYGNDVSQIKAASAQDFLNNNTRSAQEVRDAQAGGPFRVDIRGTAIVDENKADLSQSALDEIKGFSGVRLATAKEALEDNSASQIVLSDGSIAYVINDKTEGVLKGIFEDLDLARQIQQLSPEDPRSADPLLYLETASKLDPKTSGVGESIIDTSKYLVDFIKSSGLTTGQKQGLVDAVSVTLQGTGELVKIFSDAAFATGLVSRDNAAAQAAKKVSEYGSSIQSAGTKQQEENILKSISDAKGVWGTLGATVKAIADNPAGALTMLGKEGVQEIPLLLASGGMGRLALGVAGKGLAYATATGTNVFLNGAESFGANFGETYDNIRKQGGTHDQAMTQGWKAGAQGALAAGLLSGVADASLVKTFMGDVGKITAPQFAGMAAKQYAEGWGSEFVENASMQYNSFGQVDWQQSRNAGAIGGILEMGVASGLMAPSAISQNLPVARDVNGNVVTLSEYLSGVKQIQPGSFNFDAITAKVGDAQVSLSDLSRVADVATADPNFSLTAYKTNLDNLAGTGYDNADIGNIALSVTQSPDAQTLTQNLQSLGLQGSDLATAVDVKFDDAAVTTKEAADAFKQYGYFNPDTQTIESFAGVKSEADLVAAVSNYVDRNYIDIQEVKAAAAQQGVTLTDEQAADFIGQRDQSEAETLTRQFADPLAVMRQEAVDSLIAAGYTPELALQAADQFVGQYAESELGGRTQTYVGERQVTEAEARAMLEAVGYTNPTQEEINRFVATTANPIEASTKTAVESFADPLVVAAEEVREAYRQLGLPDPTEADVQALVGKYLEADLSGKAAESLDTARYNSLAQKINQLATGGVDPAMESRLTAAIESAKAEGLQGDVALQSAIDAVAIDLGTSREVLLGQIGKTENQLRTEFATQLGSISTELGNVEGRLTAAIESAKSQGMSSDAALQSAISAVAADLGTSKEALLGQIGKTEAQLRSDFSTQLGAVTTELGNVEIRLNTAIEAAKTSGLAGDAALNAAIESVAGDLGTTREALLGQIGKTETQLRSDFATQLGAVTTELGNVETRLSAAIDAAKASGLQGDAALQAAINSVSSELGTTKEALLGQLGKTETQLRTDFSTQLGQVQAELGNVESRLTAAIDAAKASGLQGDAALQAAIQSVAGDLGTTRENLLSQLGTTEAALRTEFSTQLGGVTAELGNVESRLTAAIAAAKASGLQGDAALQAAINSVSSELGTTKQDLLGQIGKTEEQLRTDFSTQLGAVTTEIGNVETRLQDAIAAAKASGLAGDAALNQAIQSVAADLGVTKESLLGQIGKTEQTLRTDFATELGGVREELGGVETRLTQAIADAKAAGLQGDAALDAAIQAVAGDLGIAKTDLLSQIGKSEETLRTQFATELGGVRKELTGVEKRLQDAIAAAEASGLSRDQALTAAIDSVASDLGVTKNDLLGQIGKSEQTLRQELQAGLGGVETQIGNVEQRLSSAIAAAEAAGMSRDQAITAAINSVASDLGTTKADLLTQLGTTEQALRSQFTSQLGDVESRLQSAIAAAEASGMSRDQALQSALNTVAADLGTTKADLISQIGTTESTLRGEIEASQTALGQQIESTEQRLTQAIAAAEARGMTRDQAIQSGLDQVASDLGTTRQDLLTQLGQTQSALSSEIQASQQTLGQQITSTESRLNDAIAAAEARGLTRYQAIQAGLTQVATDLGTSRADILSQLGATASDLRAEIEASQTALGQQITTGLEGLGTALSDAEARINTRASEYEAQGLSRDQALSRAIGDVATQLGTTAQNLQGQITEAKTQLSGQITSGQTALQKQIDEASTLLGKPAQAVTQADLDYVNSVIKGEVTTAPDLTYDVNRDGKIDQSDYDFLNRATTGSGEPPEFAPGSRWAPTGLFGEISGLKTDLTGQLQQMERQRIADEEKDKAARLALQRRQTGLEMLQPAAGPSKTQAAPTVSPLQTSGQSKFLGPLAAFFSQVEKGDFTPSTQQQTTMAPQQQQQTQPDRYAYGKETSIDALLDPYGENKSQEQQSPFGFKAGGLATPLFASGGGTRYGKYAKGGLNVVHHSGKARVDFRHGDAVTGPGDGQSDDIPAMLADGEFVFPADVVAALGNGSTKAGSDKLYDMMHSIRAHARSSGPKDLPPPAKSPLEYLKKTSKQKSARG